MWRQQVKQHLDAHEEEEEMSMDFERVSQKREKYEGSQILGAVFSPSQHLHIIGLYLIILSCRFWKLMVLA